VVSHARGALQHRIGMIRQRVIHNPRHGCLTTAAPHES